MSDGQAWHDVADENSLTERELEVLNLKARRRTNAEIGEQLFISITTVKWYVRQIYNKLGVNNRSEATAAARQLGLLDQPRDRKTVRHDNLPLPLTPFIGRKRELDELTATLADPHSRLITITGPGGMGKTRLAIQTASILKDRFANGVCWVTFSHQDATEFVFATIDEYIGLTICAALGLSLQGEENAWELMSRFLQEKEVLIALDRFEHLVSSAPQIRRLLAKAPACRVLVSSRERLNVPGEVVLAMQGMPITDEESKDPFAADAVNLFLQAAKRVANNNYRDQDTLAMIQRICSQLEGMPLAIELAAEWTRLLSVTEIEQELEHGLEFLDGSTSMRAVIDRSWNLLSAKEQKYFARLSVFQGSFSRDAACYVAVVDLDTLSTLYDKSLIQRSREDRYTIHDLLRQYAGEQLLAQGEVEEVRDAHCDYFAALADEQLESLFRGDHGAIMVDLNNVRAAWRWGVRRRRLEDLRIMLFPMDWFYNLRAYYAEGAAAMQMAIDEFQMVEPTGLQGIVYGKALVNHGLEQSRIYGADAVEPTVRQGLAILRQLNAREDLAWAQLLSLFAGILLDPHEREQCCLESLALFEELDNDYGIAFSLAVLGSIQRQAGRYEESQKNIERGLAVSRSLDDPEGEAHALRHLGHLNLHMGRYEAAYLNFQEEYALWRELSLPRLAGEALRYWGETCLARGAYGEAEAVLQESLAEFEQVGDHGNAVWALTDLAEMACLQERPKKALAFLDDARAIMQQRRDSKEQTRWWQLSGRVALQQGNVKNARLAFEHALAYSLQSQGMVIVESILDFANLQRVESDLESAARLLGFVQVQPGLSATLIQRQIEPLRSSLSAARGEHWLAMMAEEGAQLDQQTILKTLQTDIGPRS